jgi:hypothetical protein
MLAFICAAAAAFVALLALIADGAGKLWWYLLFLALYFAFSAWAPGPSVRRQPSSPQ